jgi:hypothetical protein
MTRNYYLPGSWNCTCDSCSKKIKATEAKQRWDGFLVCPDCFEPRQPQDFVKPRQDQISVPFSRPIPTYEFVPQNWTEPIRDYVVTDENLSLVVSWVRPLTDAVSSSDSTILNFGSTVADTITTTDNINILVYTLVSVEDTVTTTDSISTVATSSTQIDGSAINGELL